jgi:phosphoglycolate phosphatase
VRLRKHVPVLSQPSSRAVPIRGIFFDKDGTLLDYAASWIPVNRRAADCAAAGDAELAARLLRIGGLDPRTGRIAPEGILATGSTEEIAAIWIDGGAPHALPALTHALDNLFRSAVDDVVPVTDLAALFVRLRARGLRIGIGSNDSEQAIGATLARFGLAHLTDFFAGYDSGFGAKPAPGMIFEFCTAVDLLPSQIAVVGDSAPDMLMGHAAGVGLRVGVLTGTGTRATLSAHAEMCVDSVEALEKVLFG